MDLSEVSNEIMLYYMEWNPIKASAMNQFSIDTIQY